MALIGRTFEVIKEMHTKSGATFSVGDKCRLEGFKPTSYNAMFSKGDDKVNISCAYAYKCFKGFPKPPSMNQLEKWSYDSVCKAIDGTMVEPDGEHDGVPSWLLAMGLI